MRRAVPILLGVTVYVTLMFAVYALPRLIAFPSNPAWFSSTELLIKTLAAIAPGFLAAWLHERPGFVIGATTGVLGVVAESGIAIIRFSVPFGEWTGRIVPWVVALGAATAFTNGVAGMAAEALRKRKHVAL
jgi:hypothetical protein